MQLTKGCKRKVRELLAFADTAFQACRDVGDKLRELDSRIAFEQRGLTKADQDLASAQQQLVSSAYPATSREQLLEPYLKARAQLVERLTDLTERRDDLRQQLETNLRPLAQRAGAVAEALKKYLQISGDDLDQVPSMPGMGVVGGFVHRGGSSVSRGADLSSFNQGGGAA